MSSSGRSTQNPCGSPPPNPVDGETRLPCKSATVSSSTPKDSCLPTPTNLGITNCCSRLGIAPREAVEAQGGGIDKGTPLHVLERLPGCAMGPGQARVIGLNLLITITFVSPSPADENHLIFIDVYPSRRKLL
jgi:hypothetical protein